MKALYIGLRYRLGVLKDPHSYGLWAVTTLGTWQSGLLGL